MKVRDRMRVAGCCAVDLVLLAALGGCQSQKPVQEKAPRADSSSTTEETRTVTGTVRHVDLEGGFYGIVTDDGTNLDPVNLPEEFRQDGVRLEARVAPLRDRVSIHMWGTPVRIIEFKRLTA